jgi:hypothetical protein
VTDPSRIRVVDASTDETIEIHWMRRIKDPRADPPKDLTEILITRHTAPPSAVWDAQKQKDTDD